MTAYIRNSDGKIVNNFEAMAQINQEHPDLYVAPADIPNYGFTLYTYTPQPPAAQWCAVVEGTPVNGVQTWVQQPLAQDEIIRRCTTALDEHYAKVAQSKGYDNQYTCALRAGYPSVFQAEGKAFAEWMDGCNAQAYQLMQDVKNGVKPMPADEAALVATLPAMVWP